MSHTYSVAATYDNDEGRHTINYGRGFTLAAAMVASNEALLQSISYNDDEWIGRFVSIQIVAHAAV